MDLWFSPPVRVIIESGYIDNVSSVAKAARLLVEDWPTEDFARTRAIQACYDAYQGTGTVDDARRYFEAAAAEAKVLVGPPPVIKT